MNEEKARAILGEAIQKDNSIGSAHQYMCWRRDDKEIVMDSSFTADELEAIAWWMRNFSANTK